MESGSVLNYFSNTTYPTILIQGIVLTLSILLSLYFFYKNLLYFLSEIAPKLHSLIKEYSEETVKSVPDIIKIFQPGKNSEGTFDRSIELLINTIVGFVLVIIILLSGGILSNRVGDKWMDGDNIDHLYLKVMWLDASIYNCSKKADSLKFNNTDDAIKCHVFDKIMGKYLNDSCGGREEKELNAKEKHEIYYYFKNRMIMQVRWCDYLNVTQNIINLTQVLAFSFFIIIASQFASLFLLFLKETIEVFKKKSGRFATARIVGIFVFSITLVAIVCRCIFFKNTLYITPVILFSPLVASIILYMKKDKPSIHAFATSFIIYIAILGYYCSCLAWVENETEFDNKVFGQYIVINKSLRETNPVLIKFFRGADISDDGSDK